MFIRYEFVHWICEKRSEGEHHPSFGVLGRVGQGGPPTDVLGGSFLRALVRPVTKQLLGL